tara:strand:+ start:1199 stop:1339 length:141 start_codon:yes stop_codon:yes gene_type:complete
MGSNKIKLSNTITPCSMLALPRKIANQPIVKLPLSPAIRKALLKIP